MKKILIISLMTMILLCGCNKEDKEETFEAKLGQVQDLTESNKEIPNFTIDIEGKYDISITDKDLTNIKLYDFIVDVTAYDIDPDSDIYHEKWTGVKLLDVLNAKEIKEYDTIDFKSTGGITVRYKKDEINEKMYLVFYRNDRLLSESEETPVMLFVPELKNRFWVPSLTRIDVI